MAFQAFIYNNTNNVVKVAIMGPQTEARFILAPGTICPFTVSPGYKALVAFANGALFAMRPIRATANSQVFSVNPNPGPPDGPDICVSRSAEPDDVNTDGLPQGDAVQEQPLLQDFGPGT